MFFMETSSTRSAYSFLGLLLILGEVNDASEGDFDLDFGTGIGLVADLVCANLEAGLKVGREARSDARLGLLRRTSPFAKSATCDGGGSLKKLLLVVILQLVVLRGGNLDKVCWPIVIDVGTSSSLCSTIIRCIRLASGVR